LHLLLDGDCLLLVFTALVLEPNPDDPGTEAGHLDELLLHEGVRPGVGVVARAQRVQLLLVQHRPHARRLAVRRAFAAATVAAAAVPAASLPNLRRPRRVRRV
jgi:hypothetical protein